MIHPLTAWRRLGRPWRVLIGGGVGALVAVYAAIGALIFVHAQGVFAHPPSHDADVALVLGNRAYLKGKPNPCLTGRVDTGLALADTGRVKALAFSGGVDTETGHIEAEVMRAHAVARGFTGPMLLERASTSTRLNLALSRPVLQQAGMHSVVIVSEPFHLWRIERLVKMSGFDKDFDVQYAASPTSCWLALGPFSKGALREPAAIINNAWHGYLF